MGNASDRFESRYDMHDAGDAVGDHLGRVVAGVVTAVVLTAGAGLLTVNASVADAVCAMAVPTMVDNNVCFDITRPRP